MFERHFGLRENPFHSGHQMRFLYPSREHQEARAHLRYGIENREPFVLITGEVGTGKTTALYDALAEWGSRVSVALVTNSALTREEMIEEISLRFGLPLPAGASKPQALAQLERHLLSVRNRGEHAVLLLDEAQNLAPELLEEIRLLSNLEMQGEKLVQIFLVGQPELEAKLADPQLRQLRQRISVHYRLNPLSPEETAGYIHHRISVAGGNPWSAFPPEACREVYRVTHGIPREINTVATQAMITAYAEGEPSVSRAHVQAVARENDFHSVLGSPAEMPNEEFPVAPPARAEVVSPPAPKPEVKEAPAWSPPELESGTATPKTPKDSSHIEPDLREELDAWSRAAFGLLEARRKRAAEPVPAAPVAEPTMAEWPARFPTPAELRTRSEKADPGNADLSRLPARLREKIADDIAGEERSHRTMPLVLAAVAVAAIAFGLVLAQRFQVIDIPFLRPVEGLAIAGKPTLPPARAALVAQVAAPVSVDTATAPADSARASQDSTRTSRDSTNVANAAAASPAGPAAPAAHAAPVAGGPPASTTAKPAATPATPVAAAPVTAPVATVVKGDTLVFAIGVGSYLDRDRARQERDRLSTRSGLPGLVIAVNSSGTTMYRIVLGRYPSNAAATRAASDFMATYGVDEAQPLLLSRTRAR